MSGGDDRRNTSPIQAPMVGWYEPLQLARTGVETVVSALVGQRADFRAMQALGATKVEFDCSDGDDAWIDYVSDTGDGFASTYAVAQALARETLPAAYYEGKTPVRREVPRGCVLVMGGDEVYPTPSPQEYQDRLVGPYASALPRREQADDPSRPKLFAIPGNHDWYDGLGAFMSLFCTAQDIGDWRVPQQRSYFVLKLPHRVWLVGVDVQLTHDVDRAQSEAILKVLREGGAAAGDRVIFCVSEPDWFYRSADVDEHPHLHLDALRADIDRTGAAIVLQIAGDLHHYRRQSDAAGERHLVTAGGGGAFLHPTHTTLPQPYRTLGGTYTCAEQTEFPSRARSRRIAARALIFPQQNPQFGLTTALLYVILGLVMPPAPLPGPHLQLWPLQIALGGIASVHERPASMAWVLLVIGFFFAFTDTRSRLYRFVAGFGHGSTHLLAALVGGICAREIELKVFDPEAPESFARLGGVGVTLGKALSLLAYVGTLALWGYLVGAAIFGLYLWVSVRIFGRHSNEAFSAIRHEGYKNFLRMHVTADAIEVFAFGLEEVAPASKYEWDGARWILRGEASPAPHLIERFVAKAPRK